ncbi:DRP3A [Scenedesmus sp. PABB004]|nr:DRP3A [Scenedesmus sp. PABB004]
MAPWGQRQRSQPTSSGGSGSGGGDPPPPAPGGGGPAMAPGGGPEVLGDSLIPVINKLQDIFSQVTVELKLGLPQVAVVGSQSSGKSSVLEALLIKTPAGGGGAPGGAAGGAGQCEWGEFLHAPGKIFYDFDRIRAEIQHETERVSGGNKNISDKPIRLKIFSPHVLTMTLIDLPGITKVPVGDQPSNIEQRVREMVLQYIREPSCIILAVSAANTDLANSDALQMAQLVDAEGARTIGVLTKLDIMDRGTSAAPALRNQVVPLRLGYTGIVNRSQADINANKSMADARSAEAAWFDAHSEYAEVAGQCGVGNLARRINVILGNHIRVMLPTLRRQISEALEAKAAELRGYGQALDLESESARGAALLQMLCGYAERFGALLQGHSEDMPLSELMGGARIRHIFQEVFGRQLRTLDPFRELGDEDVRTAIKNSSGVAGTLLIPQEPFELLVRRSIGRLMSPALACKELVHEELLKIAEAAAPRDLGRFPALRRRLAAAVLEYIQAGAEPAEKMIRELVACEHDYINTDHPDFLGGTRAVKAVMEAREARKAAAADGSFDVRPDLHKAKSAGNILLAAGSSSGSGGGGSGPGGVGLSGLAAPAGLKGLRDGSSLMGGSEDLLAGRSRAVAPLPPRSGSALAVDGEELLALGSSYSLSAATTPSGKEGGSWFGWLTKSDSSRERGGERGAGSLADMAARAPDSKPRNEHEEVQVEVIRLLVCNYFEIVRSNLADLVPKALMRFLVHHSQRGLQQHLIKTLYRDSLAGELLAEREDVATARARATAAVEALQAAHATLDEGGSDAEYITAAALLHALRRGQQQQQQQPLSPSLSPSLSAAAAPSDLSQLAALIVQAATRGPAGADAAAARSYAARQLELQRAHAAAEAPHALAVQQQLRLLQVAPQPAHSAAALPAYVAPPKLEDGPERLAAAPAPAAAAKATKKRGRPAASANKVHPNLIYVRRHRERQKQMESNLEATVAARKLQVEQLQAEQRSLCEKWEALEQVLHVQSNVLGIMQQLSLAGGDGAADGALGDGYGDSGASSQSCAPQGAAAAAGDVHMADAAQPGRDAAQRAAPSASGGAPEPPASPAHSRASASPSPLPAAAAEVVAAALRAPTPARDAPGDPAALQQQARHWLEPVRLYTLRAALMLEALGMLPDNAAAARALAAARRCSAVAAGAAAARSPQATAAAVEAAIAAAAAEARPAAAAAAAAGVAAAVRSAWDGSAAGPGEGGRGEEVVDGVPLVRYPYTIGMYVITPEAVKNVCWPLNMETWAVDAGNDQAHVERAGRAMWAVLRPERWRLLHATWSTMAVQLQQVQQDFRRLHDLLRGIGTRRRPAASGDGAADAGGAGADVADARPHGVCLDGFATMEDSTAYEYAAAAVQVRRTASAATRHADAAARRRWRARSLRAVPRGRPAAPRQVESVLAREDAISFQLCGAFLELLDPLEIAVGFVSSWPFHPQAFTLFDVIFKLGEPPESACQPGQA